MDNLIKSGDLISYATVGVIGAIFVFIVLVTLTKDSNSPLEGFYKFIATVISILLLIASAAFNYSFTHGLLVNIIPVFAATGGLIMGLINISAFFIDLSFSKAIKEGKYFIAGMFAFSRAGLIIYSVLSASTVFNSSQIYNQEKRENTERYISALNTETLLAKQSYDRAVLKSISDKPLYNLAGHSVSMSNCKPDGHSYYLSQQVCKDYLRSISAGNQSYLKAKAHNERQAYLIAKDKPVDIKPVMGISPTFIFILVGFLLEVVALALVMYVSFFSGGTSNTPSPTPLPVQKRTVPRVVQGKSAKNGLNEADESARRALDKKLDITDAHIADLIMMLYQSNKNSRISANELNKIIKEEIGHTINKARLIDIMNDSPYIKEGVEHGKKAYFFEGELSDKKPATDDKQSQDDRGDRKPANLRDRLSQDF